MRQQTKVLVVGGGAAVIVAGAIVASLTLGSSLTTGAGTPSGPSSAPTNSASPADPPPTPSPTEGAAGDAAAPPVAVADPYYGDVVVASSAGDPAAFASGLTVELVSVTSTTVTGSGIGSASGPAIDVIVRVSNSSAATVGLAPVVNAYAGRERVPLTPDHESPLAASIAGSAQSEGSYTFALDDAGSSGADSTIWITVSTAADSGLVLFEYTR